MWTIQECEKYWTDRLEKALTERDEALKLADQSSVMCAEWHAKAVKLEKRLKDAEKKLKDANALIAQL